MQSQNKIFGDGVIFSHGSPTLLQTQMYQQVHHRQCCFIDSLKQGVASEKTVASADMPDTRIRQ